MSNENFGSARVIIDGKGVPIYGDVKVKFGDYLDTNNGQWYVTEKKQLIDGGGSSSAVPLRKAFTPEIMIPRQGKESEIASLKLTSGIINAQVSFGGVTYSVTGGFIATDGLEINSGSGEISEFTITGGVYRELKKG